MTTLQLNMTLTVATYKDQQEKKNAGLQITIDCTEAYVRLCTRLQDSPYLVSVTETFTSLIS